MGGCEKGSDPFSHPGFGGKFLTVVCLALTSVLGSRNLFRNFKDESFPCCRLDLGLRDRGVKENSKCMLDESMHPWPSSDVSYEFMSMLSSLLPWSPVLFMNRFCSTLSNEYIYISRSLTVMNLRREFLAQTCVFYVFWVLYTYIGELSQKPGVVGDPVPSWYAFDSFHNLVYTWHQVISILRRSACKLNSVVYNDFLDIKELSFRILGRNQ